MSLEQIASLSEQQRIDLEKIAQKMRSAGIGYPAAVRQVIKGRGVFNEANIKKHMSALTTHIDAEIKRQNHEAEAQATAKDDIEAILAEIRREEQLADVREVARERGDDPDD